MSSSYKMQLARPVSSPHSSLYRSAHPRTDQARRAERQQRREARERSRSRSRAYSPSRSPPAASGFAAIALAGTTMPTRRLSMPDSYLDEAATPMPGSPVDTPRGGSRERTAGDETPPARPPPAVLRGLLTLTLNKPSKVRKITLRFKGVSRTEWPEGAAAALFRLRNLVVENAQASDHAGSRSAKIRRSSTPLSPSFPLLSPPHLLCDAQIPTKPSQEPKSSTFDKEEDSLAHLRSCPGEKPRSIPPPTPTTAHEMRLDLVPTP